MVYGGCSLRLVFGIGLKWGFILWVVLLGDELLGIWCCWVFGSMYTRTFLNVCI